MKTLVILSLLFLLAGCVGPAAPQNAPTTPSQPSDAAPAGGTPSPSPSPVTPVTPVGQITATPTPTVPPSPLPTTTSLPPGPAVSVGGARIPVEVAATSQERAQGLSGRSQLPAGTGMLFIYDDPGIYAFWMVEMQFPLDFVWIGPQCVVVDLTPNVPPPMPGQERGDLPRYRPAEPVRYVLEINAGEIAAAGMQIGDAVAFEEIPNVDGGC